MEPVEEKQEEDVLQIDIRRYLDALRRYIWLILALIALAIAGSVVYTSRLTKIYEATASVQIEPSLPDLLGTGNLLNITAAGGNTTEYYKQQKQVLGSHTLVKLTIEQFDLIPKLLSDTERKDLSRTDQIDLATNRLQAAITIRYPDQDRIFYVSVRHADPQFAMEIANAHVATYVSYAKGKITANSATASDALQAEFTDAEAKLRAAEDKIYKFQAANDMIAVTLEEHQNLVSANILSFTAKLNEARSKEIEIASRLAMIKKQAKEDVLATPIVMMVDNSSFETIRGHYYTEKNKLLELQKDLGPKHPDHIAQKQKVDELYKALDTEVQIIIKGTEDLHQAAVKTSAALSSEVEKYKQEAKVLSPKIAEYNDLQREKKDLESRYTILRQRLSTTQMSGGISSYMTNVFPLDPAQVPTRPVSPNMRANVAIGITISLFLGIVIVFLLVFLDRSIKSAADATQAANAPVLGVIPSLSDDVSLKDDRTRDLYVFHNPTSHVAECCRSLRTNIMFSSADHPMNTLVVCSANPREGKTTSVLYLGTTLAQSMAESGQKVLLIDTDMRRPRLHASTGVSRQVGLSNLLIGSDDYEGVIKATEIPNLYILPCGPLPPNPAEMLMTKRFETVLAELSKRFARIILDSPPLPYTDAVVLSKKTDGVILVVRSGKTLREELRRSSRTIRSVGGLVVGVIVNELNKGDHGGYYYGYYGYKYGYGDDAKESSPEPA